jgi:hypothetical protein
VPAREQFMSASQLMELTELMELAELAFVTMDLEHRRIRARRRGSGHFRCQRERHGGRTRGDS